MPNTLAIGYTERLRTSVWLIALVVAPLGLLSESAVAWVTASIVGFGVIALTVRMPGPFLVLLIWFLPLQTHLLAAAHRLGIPTGLLRGAGLTKDAIVIGLAVAAFLKARGDRQRLDKLDRAALALGAIVLLYVIVPALADPLVGSVLTHSTASWYIRGRAVRALLGPFVLLLAVRSIDLAPVWRQRIIQSIIAVACLVAAGGIIEFFATGLWTSYSQDVLHLSAYYEQVLGTTAPDPVVGGSVLGREVVRAGSSVGYLVLGFYLLPAIGLLFVRASDQLRASRFFWLGVVLLGSIVTLTRSSILAAIVALAVAAWLMRQRHTRVGSHMVVTAGAGLIVIVLVASATGLLDRTLAAFTGDDPSAQVHIDRTSDVIDTVLESPLGLGVGAHLSGPGGDTIIAENSYLLAAVDIGIIGAALLILTLWRTFALLMRDRTEVVTAGLAGVVAGLAVAGLVTHVWNRIPSTWTLMIAVGLYVRRTASSASSRPIGEHTGTPAHAIARLARQP